MKKDRPKIETTLLASEEEFLESRSRSFNRLWPIAEDYVIAAKDPKHPSLLAREGYILPIHEGWIVHPRTVREHKQHYLPMGRPELPGEFARLADEDEEIVLDFTRRYGLLGYHCALRFPYEVVSAHQMKMYNYDSPGDPLCWVFAHSKAVSLIMSLAEALDKPKELKVLIEKLSVEKERPSEGNGRLVSYWLPVRAFGLPGRVQTSTKASARENALSIIESILNANLSGVAREMITEWNEARGKQSIATCFVFENLLDCIYWLLADAVTNAKIRSCEHCGKPFVAPNDRTKYCPPLQWETVSRCMNRAKQSRFRSKRKRGG